METSLERIEKLSHSTTDTLEVKMQQYDEWSNNYENDVDNLDYRAPKICVDYLYEVVESGGITLSEDTKIIDFAAGTGLVGEFLRKKQFTGLIDAHDGSLGMITIAKTKEIYSNFYVCIVKPEIPLPIPVDYYDVALVAGALSDSQIHPGCLKSILRHIKLGGICVFSTRANKSNINYKKLLDIEVEKLEKAGVWKRMLVAEVREFERATSFKEVDQTGVQQLNSETFPFISGVVYCYKKL